MPLYAYIVVEGPHDVEFVYRLLSTWGLKRIARFTDLEPYWQRLVPRTFPHDDELQKRVPSPLFVRSPSHSIAIHDAGGDTRIVPVVEESLAVLLDRTLDSVGVVLDGDYERSVESRFEVVRSGLTALNLSEPNSPGEISAGPPATGVFILPDNSAAGTLEDLLIDCAELEYPRLLKGATEFVQSVNENDPTLRADNNVEFFRPAGKRKAQVACVASILKPGRAVQVSIQDNRWLRGEALNLPRIAAVRQFLQNLLQLP